MSNPQTTTQKSYKLIVYYARANSAEVLVHAENFDEARKKAEKLWLSKNPDSQILEIEIP